MIKFPSEKKRAISSQWSHVSLQRHCVQCGGNHIRRQRIDQRAEAYRTEVSSSRARGRCRGTKYKSGWTCDGLCCCCRYLLQYQEPMPCEQLVTVLCDIKQAYTQFGGTEQQTSGSSRWNQLLGWSMQSFVSLSFWLFGRRSDRSKISLYFICKSRSCWSWETFYRWSPISSFATMSGECKVSIGCNCYNMTQDDKRVIFLTAFCSLEYFALFFQTGRVAKLSVSQLLLYNVDQSFV